MTFCGDYRAATAAADAAKKGVGALASQKHKVGDQNAIHAWSSLALSRLTAGKDLNIVFEQARMPRSAPMGANMPPCVG